MSLLRFGRHCICCLKELAPSQRLDAFFCPPEKAPDKPRKRKSTQRPVSACWRLWNLKRHTVRRLSISMEELEKKVSQCAGLAFYYRVQGFIDDKAWMFPALDRPTLRFDGHMRQTPGFLVSPFEPPVVPRRGNYAFTFYNSQGHIVTTPEGCYEFLVEPVLLVGVETGTLLRDFQE